MNMHEYKPFKYSGERVCFDKGIVLANSDNFKETLREYVIKEVH